jgi:hypothetical protein
MLIIADSFALIVLETCQSLKLLESLFKEVLVPKAVFDEVIVDGKAVSERLSKYLKDKIRQIDHTIVVINAGGLGSGEIESMVLYKQLHADYLLIDDKRARKVAKMNNITIIGSQGILLLAKKEGLIPKVKPFLDKLSTSEIYIHERLISKTLRLANENEYE